VFGFQLSDYILKPFRAFFMHVNPRHHSLALIETGTNGMHHLMVELFSFDDVGQAYDIALTDPERIGVTPGRHTNDHVTSFYSRSPSGFTVEYGWGGRCVLGILRAGNRAALLLFSWHRRAPPNPGGE
jgi:hypothetical protein